MPYNTLSKFFSSLPVILISLYFIPFLGVILLLFRLFTRKNVNIKTCVFLIILGISVLIIKYGINLLSKNITNSVLLKVSNFFNNTPSIISFSKLCIIMGVILIIISIIIQKIFDKGVDSIKKYIQNEEDKSYKIKKENDLIMQEKREKAKNTRNIVCKHCGASNLVSEKVGKCKYCRQYLQ
ncbi:MAG: hypothetical protein E7158_01060 [Firmicutes bacterium]|nr:hypothetical protein [Bacillota bacterium]